MLESNIEQVIRYLAASVHATSCAKGWWADPNVNIPEKIAMQHEELSEALGEYRHGRMRNWVGEDGKPEGFAVEMADEFIRKLDLLEKLGMTNAFIDGLICKMAYNKTRPYRHGNKAC